MNSDFMKLFIIDSDGKLKKYDKELSFKWLERLNYVIDLCEKRKQGYEKYIQMLKDSDIKNKLGEMAELRCRIQEYEDILNIAKGGYRDETNNN